MRLYLHIRDGDRLIEDPEGAEFDTLDAAREEAVKAARDLLATRLRAGAVLYGQKFEICDEAGELLATIPFRSTLRLD